MKLRLQVRQSANKAFTWEHTAPMARVGRDPECELSLQGEGSQSVSWNHARLELTPDGAYVTDLGSSNGTFINGKRTEGRARFQVGDYIELGHTGPKLQVAELIGCGKASKAHAATAYEPLPAAPIAAKPIPVAPAIPARVQSGIAPSARSVDAAAGGTTRMMLVNLQSSQRRNMMLLGIAAACVVVLLLIIFGLLIAFGVVVFSKKPQVAQAEPAVAAPSTGLTPKEIYQQTLRSTCWIVVRLPGGMGTGTGSLVDRDWRLVVTAQHVVGNQKEVAVFFPHFENGKAENRKGFYLDPQNADRLGHRGRVVARDVQHDLALVQLEEVPSEVVVLQIAEESPAPGETVYSVGNPLDLNTAMWQATTGTVRQVTHKQWRYGEDKLDRDADVLETQAPVNPGDSGGPVVNSEGKLVAIVAGSRGGVNLMTLFVDRGEVLKLLAAKRRMP
jgi:S1-C subfamily serine protease